MKNYEAANIVLRRHRGHLTMHSTTSSLVKDQAVKRDARVEDQRFLQGPAEQEPEWVALTRHGVRHLLHTGRGCWCSRTWTTLMRTPSSGPSCAHTSLSPECTRTSMPSCPPEEPQEVHG
eukprot:1195552-Heterocapsa_arctica.AAC.1